MAGIYDLNMFELFYIFYVICQITLSFSTSKIPFVYHWHLMCLIAWLLVQPRKAGNKLKLLLEKILWMPALYRMVTKQETIIFININFHGRIFTISSWTPSILTEQICTRTTITLLSTLLLLRVFAPTVSPTAISGALPADSPQPFFFPLHLSSHFTL